MKKYILISDTDCGLDLDGVFESPDAAFERLQKLFSAECPEYDGRDEFENGNYSAVISRERMSACYDCDDWRIVEVEL